MAAIAATGTRTIAVIQSACAAALLLKTPGSKMGLTRRAQG